MTMLHRLTEFGISTYLDELAAARERGYYQSDWLKRPGITEPFLDTSSPQPGLHAEDKYRSIPPLHEWLDGLGLLRRHDIWQDRGFWSWLAAVNMAVLTDRTGDREVITEDGSFVLVPGRERASWRHKLASPVRLFDRHGELSRVSLEGRLYQHGDPMEQTSSVNKILQSRAVMEVIHALYWDDEKQDRKRGSMTGRKDQPGNIRRLKVYLEQIDRTYDLETLDARDLMSMLPREFDRFRPRVAATA